MKCPYCGSFESKVVDSRPTEDGERIRRRRECVDCSKRFTTFETIELSPIMVQKKNGSIQAFNRDKLLNGMIKSCEKRPVAIKDLEKAVDNIEYKIVNSLKSEVSSAELGDMVMEELKRLDEVAYVRFASVYRQFSDIQSFYKEISDEYYNVVRVRIITADEIDKETVDNIIKTVKCFSKGDIVYTTETDKDIIGGIIVHVDSVVYDYSVKNQVNRLQDKFINSGGNKIFKIF